ncbi:cytochrome b [Rudaea sp.]|uniref:cytochrome b n=1 Tax=Rudaea sp. TaxID=2136325 RepID=UPI002ED5D0BC
MSLPTRSVPQPQSDLRYDRTTILLHWIVVVFVIGLYAAAIIWGELPRGTPTRKLLQALHISFGLLFIVVLALRVYWRLFRRLRLPDPSSSAAQNLIASIVQNGLYVMLVVQAVIGVCWRIAQQEPLAFFWMFEFPEPQIFDKATKQLLGLAHEYLGHAIIIVAAFHALAGLYHHLVLKDGLMRRILPGSLR